jgi:hypothetical protein
LGKAFSAQIESDLGVEVTLADYALPGLSAGEVLADLRSDTPPYRRLSPEAIEALRQVQVVVMFVKPVHSVSPAHPLDLLACFGNREPASCSPDLSRHDAFNKPDHEQDPRENGYIEADGQHPSALAGQFTAELLSQIGYEPVSPCTDERAACPAGPGRLAESVCRARSWGQLQAGPHPMAAGPRSARWSP